jgi:hypothetical protein
MSSLLDQVVMMAAHFRAKFKNMLAPIRATAMNVKPPLENWSKTIASQVKSIGKAVPTDPRLKDVDKLNRYSRYNSPYPSPRNSKNTNMVIEHMVNFTRSGLSARIPLTGMMQKHFMRNKTGNWKCCFPSKKVKLGQNNLPGPTATWKDSVGVAGGGRKFRTEKIWQKSVHLCSNVWCPLEQRLNHTFAVLVTNKDGWVWKHHVEVGNRVPRKDWFWFSLLLTTQTNLPILWC